MARLRVQEALGERWAEAQERLWAAFARFRESRLYVQSICTVVLVGAACLVHWLPYGPMGRANVVLNGAVKQDYDFRGRAGQLYDWARRKGGWGPAVSGLWQQGWQHVRQWVGPVGPFAEPMTTRADPADPQPGAGSIQPQLLPPLLPVDGSVLWEYGWLPQGVGEEFHEGIDLYAQPGAAVVAVLDGTVQAIRQDGRLGSVVEVKHGGDIAVYAQIEAVAVRAGDAVRRGQRLGAVARPRGAEERMPPHLHFEIRPVDTGQPVNPASYLGLGGKKL
jgi:murein DD-endopeptidase MepM/ murein hydrolase activator NlpD